MYVFTPKRRCPICHVLLTVQNSLTRIGGRSYSSTTDNSLDFYTNKTKQQLQTQTYCHLLGLEETSSVAYELGETYYYYYFSLNFMPIYTIAEPIPWA